MKSHSTICCSLPLRLTECDPINPTLHWGRLWHRGMTACCRAAYTGFWAISFRAWCSKLQNTLTQINPAAPWAEAGRNTSHTRKQHCTTWRSSWNVSTDESPTACSNFCQRDFLHVGVNFHLRYCQQIYPQCVLAPRSNTCTSTETYRSKNVRSVSCISYLSVGLHSHTKTKINLTTAHHSWATGEMDHWLIKCITSWFFVLKPGLCGSSAELRAQCYRVEQKSGAGLNCTSAGTY